MAGNIIDQWFAAASVEENYQTMHVWDGDGNASRVFEINFQGGYINQADVKAFMVNKTTQERTDLTVKFTGTNTVTLSAVVPTTHQVTIYRDTNKVAPLASFQDGAIITAANLDRNAKQAVFAVAEMVDRFDSVTATAQDAIATAYSAMSTANGAVTTANGAVTTANIAKTAASNAVTTANNASTAASNAVNVAGQANATATSANNTANGIDAKATKAMSDAAAAVTTANGIDAKATKAMSDAAAAVNTADDANTTATGIDAKATKALSDAATAVSTANDAKANIDSATVNLNKLYNTADSISGTQVTWKGTHFFPALEISSDTPFIDFHYGKSTADYTSRLVADNANRLKVTNGFMVGSDLNVAGTAAVTGRATFSEIIQAQGSYINGNLASVSNRQGLHTYWNESGVGEAAFVNNQGSGSGGFHFRNVNSNNTSQSGDFWMRPNGEFKASQSVYAANAILSTDGNIYGTRWGGWAYEWCKNPANLWQTVNGRTQGWTSVNSNYLGLIVDGGGYGINMFASDAELKTNVVQASPDEALADLCRFVLTEFDIQTFAGAESTHQEYGFIAQQVEDIIPSAIFKVEGGYRQVNLLPLVAALIGSVQALNNRVIELESKQD